MAVLLLILGLIIALVAHVACKMAERRAKETYRELVGDEHTSQTPPEEDVWAGVRPLVGGWGCLVTFFEFVRGLGALLALGSALYLIAAR